MRLSGTITWTSSNTSIATVNAKGVVTGKAGGTVTITAKHADSGLSDTCQVSVKEIAITSGGGVIYKGATTTVKINETYKPTGTITWTSSDTSIATVNANGVVTGKAGGIVTITATNSTLKDTCQITVRDVDIALTSATLNKGETKTLGLTVYAPSGTITWTSSNTNVATVNASGVVTGKSGGTVTITAKHAATGLSDTCTINVKDINIVESIEIINKGDKITLTLSNYKPSGTITWISSNTSIATVSSTGVVTAQLGGTVTITAKHAGSGLSDTCTINIYELDITKTSIDINKGKTTTLTLGNYTPDGTITWTSSNTNVATVNSSGVVTGKAGGTATITAKHAATGLSDTCAVNVKEVVLKQNSELTGYKGKTITLSINDTYKPVGTITWTSSNTNVATVSSSGVVTCKAGGTVTITAKHGDSGLSDSCKIYVKEVDITNTSVNVNKGATTTLTLNATNKPDGTISWSSNNTDVATISASGVVTGKAAGTVKITALHPVSGIKDSCTVVVRDVDITDTRVELYKGYTTTLTLSAYKPTGTITWSSSNTSIATVSNSGVVTGKAAGTATITATSGGMKDTCTVKVKHVNITQSAVVLKQGNYTKLTLDSYAPTSGITWSSTSSSVATAGSDGSVTAKSGGQISIKATHAASGLSDTCTVTVLGAVTWEPTYFPSFSLGTGYSRMICFNYKATNPGTLKFKISNTSVLSFEGMFDAPASTGYDKYISIKALKSGTATITPYVTYQGADHYFDNQKITVTAN